MRGRFRRAYGASPLHLLALLASLALAGYAASGWFELGVGGVLKWLLLALVGHDLILVPLYTLLDRIAFGGDRRRARSASARVRAGAFIKVPTMLSGLLALVFAPEILSLDSSYRSLTGLGEGTYLGRWLAATGVMFALSALAYAFMLRRASAQAGHTSAASKADAAAAEVVHDASSDEVGEPPFSDGRHVTR